MQERLLKILAQHPLLSPEQLGVLLASHPNVIRKELKTLQEINLVARINPRSPDISPRALFYVSQNGFAQLETQKSFREYAQRLAHLWFVIEHAYAVRNFLLRMLHPFCVEQWGVEGVARFSHRNQKRALALHGWGIARLNSRVIPFLVEWDRGVFEYERQRMAHLMEWHHALRAPSNSSPYVLLVVARDLESLQAYYAQLRAASLSRNVSMPPIYFSTARELANHPIPAPIWYSTESRNKQSLFANLRTASKSTRYFQNVQLRTISTKSKTNLTDTAFDSANPTAFTSLIALKRDLSPQTKRVLNEVAAHPLLTALEIATLLDDESGQTHRALKQLTQLHLLQAHQTHNETRYVVSHVGIHYLAAVNGFGRAANQYSKARGWKKSLSQLVRHWEHTQIENKFFLEFARVAREHNARFEWRSETESRLYYTAQGRRWSFQPDGMCVYSDEKRRVQIAVEIERHRNSKKRLRDKFTWYAMYVDSLLYRTTREEEFRLLVVTPSWERARIIRRIVHELARLRASRLLPMWLTTFDLPDTQGVARPIWRKVDTWERTMCI